MDFPALDLDAASRLVFPPESHFGHAQYRFEFAPQGCERQIVLWTRAIQSSSSSQYLLVARPENAYYERVFILNYPKVVSSFQELMDNIAKPTKPFDWGQWENQTTPNFISFTRIWSPNQQLFFYVDEKKIRARGVSGFRFRFHERDQMTQMQFLECSDTDFKNRMKILWEDKSGDFRIEADWSSLKREERDEIMSECKNGDWEELRFIASLILIVRIGYEKQLPSEEMMWLLGGDNHLTLWSPKENFNTDRDEFLIEWWRAIASVFQPINMVWDGGRTDIPECMKKYGSSRGFVKIQPPTHHEILEARAQLAQWARENLGEQRARKLLDF